MGLIYFLFGLSAIFWPNIAIDWDGFTSEAQYRGSNIFVRLARVPDILAAFLVSATLPPPLRVPALRLRNQAAATMV